MSREDPQLRIRLPVELKKIIEASSKQNNRSMNAEIVTLLELAIRVCRDFGPEDGPIVQQFKEQLDAINRIYGHSRFCNTDFDDKLACLNLSGV
ncbi:Arc family DNA-binding protein [Escherichia coli]|uniref:Arc family DNA-binding protein n=1 Tax=Escherichia coli TaxID=562 RepID=UPI0006A058EE|nr:Arc family DNA-binding protein [Escherichia coli]CTU91111.1 Arc-like DNA binding domain [Escherichia coli]CTZ64219.1 Arc-like DNA binding domain [Escherichia coli]